MKDKECPKCNGKGIIPYNDNYIYCIACQGIGRIPIENINQETIKAQQEYKQVLSKYDNVEREGLLETPKRHVKALDEILGGYKDDPKQHLKIFKECGDYSDIVLIKNVEFSSVCEHHVLPFIGKAHLAYIPNKQILGASKLVRIFECFSKRLQIQERLCSDFTEFLMKNIDPIGVACVIEASHQCMTIRGIRKSGVSMVTSSVKGAFYTNIATRQELMQLISM